ncbi:MAG: hypothetical protein IKI04_00670 [Bacilli bacterium]|nr:hypothetical protein [Bacilli bacterium]
MDIFNIKSGVASLVLAATILTGCGANGDIEKNNNEKIDSVVVLFGDNTATIIKEKYVYHYTEGGLVILEFPDGSKIKTTSDTLILSEFNDYDEIEELVRDIVGEDGEINYYREKDSKVRTR